MFGLTRLPCADRTVHPYHSDGKTYCPGVYSWERTLEDLGHDPMAAVEHATSAELDTLARAAGVVGDTHAISDPHRRGGHVVIDGTLHVGPARRMMHSGQWLGPGEDPSRRRTADEVRADDAADAYERHLDRINGE